MLNILFSKSSYRIIRIIIGGIFIYSGLVKISDLSAFVSVIHAFGLVPVGELRAIAAIVISLAEIIAGIGLIFDIKGSLALIFSMLTLFMIVLIYGIKMGFDIDCGCFGSDDPVGAAFHGLRSSLVRDLIFISAVIYLYICRKINRFKPVSIVGYWKQFAFKK
ncbi:MAG: DoxX family membrane protein [Desulfamplus sp.]|nr:DoxX family membrane protein [Desulfamplus sp.]